jgi:hypothetical protein
VPVNAKPGWSRRAVLTAAGLATVALVIGVAPRPAAAQYLYDYGYPAAGYSYSPPACDYGYPAVPYSYPYSSPGYSYYPSYSYPSYSYPYRWRGERHNGWDRNWSESRRVHGGTGHAGRNTEGSAGSSGGAHAGGGGGHGGGTQAGSSPGGNGNPYNSWLGSYGSYR